jgi:hypothetical protein
LAPVRSQSPVPAMQTSPSTKRLKVDSPFLGLK